jgi:hypothetical protein
MVALILIGVPIASLVFLLLLFKLEKGLNNDKTYL